MACDRLSPHGLGARGERVSCLGCNLIETAPVTLHDGTVVCSSCEAWRAECEAREVLAMPLGIRRKWLETVEAKRGLVATDALRGVMTALWKARK
jgi:transcription elongation factor Elf1